MKIRRDIQGIRGVGVLTILLAHLGFTGFRGGYIMVDAFYVISGYVITATILAEHNARLEGDEGPGFSLAGFYLRRLKRIFPMAVLVIVVSVWLAHELWNPLRAAGVYRDGWWSFFSAENINEIRKSSDYFAKFDAHSPLEHYWSLAVEEQFYLVWPACALVLLRSKKSASDVAWRKRMLAFLSLVWVASLGYSMWFTYVNINAAYFSTFTRAWELASGALIAVASQYERFTKWISLPRQARILWLLGFSAVTYSAIRFDDNTWFPGYMALIPVLGSVAVIMAGINPVLANAFVFDNPVLVYCGRISFSLYLWHWPVIMFTPALIPVLSDGQGGITVEGKLVAFGIAFALAVFSHILIERPIIRWNIGVPEAFRRPKTPGSLIKLVRTSGNALGIAWIITALMLSSATIIKYAEKLFGGTVKTVSVSHQVAEIHTQKQDGAITKAWIATTVRETQALTDRANPRQLASLRTASYNPATSGWRCDDNHYSCLIGSANAGKRVLVIGDSHTYMWADAFKAIVRQHPNVAVNLSVTGQCPNMLDLTQIATLPSARRAIQIDRCNAYHDLIRRSAQQWHPTIIIFSDSSEGYLRSAGSDAYIPGYVDFVRWAKTISPRVAILGSVPAWPQPSVCLGQQFTGVRRCLADINGISVAVNFQRAVAKLAKIDYIETFSWFCDERLCPLFIGNTAVTPDGSHINQVLGVQLADVLWENLKGKLSVA